MKKITNALIFTALLFCALPANSTVPTNATQILKNKSMIFAVTQVIILGSGYAIENLLNLLKS